MELIKYQNRKYITKYQLYLLLILTSLNIERNVNWEKKTEDVENLFFKALVNRFWLTLESFSWFNKIVHGRPSIKRTSWKGKWYVTKSRLVVECVFHWPTDERRGAWSKLLIDFTFNFPFICYLGRICKKHVLNMNLKY